MVSADLLQPSGVVGCWSCSLCSRSFLARLNLDVVVESQCGALGLIGLRVQGPQCLATVRIGEDRPGRRKEK